jgi:hypothetical protein
MSFEAGISRPDSAPLNPPSTYRGLTLLRTPDQNYYTSLDKLFKDGKFGRDQLEAVEDIIPHLPKAPKKPASPSDAKLPASMQALQKSVVATIKDVAKYQGTKEDPFTEEAFGHHFHEARFRIMYGKKVTGKSLKIYKEIKKNVGEVYYGQIDATPLYVRVVTEYCDAVGNTDLLSEKVDRFSNGETVTVKQTVLDSLTWIENKITSSKVKDANGEDQNLYLLEYQRKNPKGHRNQRWKDSVEAVVHENGKFANHNQPIAPIEVQAIAYDALINAARLFKDERPEDAKRWTELAAKLQQATLKHFWIPDRNQFAQSLDRDEYGNLRQVKTPSSDPATLLNSQLFDNLDNETKIKFVTSIARYIYSKEFVSTAGFRSRAKSYRKIFKYADYHGVWTVWHKETHDINKGLRRWGLHRAAEGGENRLLNTGNLSGGNYEFSYVDPITGRVHYDPDGKLPIPVKPRAIIGGNTPEKNQLWSVTAAWATKRLRAKLFREGPPAQEEWQKQLDDELIKSAPKVAVLKTRAELAEAYPKNYAFKINERRGRIQMNRLLREQFGQAA